MVKNQKEKINVLQIVNSLEIGGAERVAVNLLKHLDKNHFKSFLCTISGLGPFEEELFDEDIEILNLNKSEGFKPWISFKLAKFLKKNNIHIITSHNYAPLLYGKLAMLFSGKKYLVHVDHARDFPSKKRIIGSERQLVSSPCKVIAVSNELKENLIKYEKIYHDKIQVIQNGIDGTKYNLQIDKNEKKKKLSIPSDKFVIGTGVRLAKQKGLNYLIEAIKRLKQIRNDFFVVIIGDGPEKDNLIELVKENDLEDRIKFYGFRLDLHEILHIMDIYVLPSIWEGLPLSLLEAMASKKAIIATDVGDNSKVMRHKKNGYLIHPKSPSAIVKALLFYMDDSERLKIVGEEAYKDFVKNYSIEKMIDEYQKLYLEFISN